MQNNGRLWDKNVKGYVELPSPIELQERLPLTLEHEKYILTSRREIRKILRGEDQRLLVIIGPCSMHEEEAVLEYAGRLVEVASLVQGQVLIVMRVYFEKPRTTTGWTGFLCDPRLDGSFEMAEGLERARKLLLQIAGLGLPAATEWVDPITPQYLSDLVSWGAIGARTVESQPHRQMASGLSMPIGFKNGTGGTLHSIQIAVNAILAAKAPHAFFGTNIMGRVEGVLTAGNPDCHLVLRGGERGPNYDEEHIAAACSMLEKAGLPPKLLVDCSHGNANKDHTRQPFVFREVLRQRIQGDSCIAGMMVEGHLLGGSQKLIEPSMLQHGLSITDACISWADARELLLEAAQAL